MTKARSFFFCGGQVRHSPTVGRYLVAARDIEPLELVMWVNAAALGPRMGTAPVCLQVHTHLYLHNVARQPFSLFHITRAVPQTGGWELHVPRVWVADV